MDGLGLIMNGGRLANVAKDFSGLKAISIKGLNAMSMFQNVRNVLKKKQGIF